MTREVWPPMLAAIVPRFASMTFGFFCKEPILGGRPVSSAQMKSWSSIRFAFTTVVRQRHRVRSRIAGIHDHILPIVRVVAVLNNGLGVPLPLMVPRASA